MSSAGPIIDFGLSAGGGGTVTSVGLALPAIFSVSGSPVTTTGTLTGALATQAANLVFAGPATGSAAAPTFRALVVADLPAITSAQLAALVSDETGSGLLVFGTSPTIVTPTIASFANATHSHLNAAGGGTITAAAVTDLNSAMISFTNKSGNISQWTNDSGYLTSVTAHNVLSTTHGDTSAASVVRGDLIIGNSTPAWSRLAVGAANSVITSNGTDPSWSTTPTLVGLTVNSSSVGVTFSNSGSGLVGEASNVLSQFNSANAQTFRLYNTRTDASNYERLAILWSGNTAILDTQFAGTGSSRNLHIRVNGTNNIVCGASGTLTFGGTTDVNNNTFKGAAASTAARTSDGTEGTAFTFVSNRGASGTVTRTLQTFVTPLWITRIATQSFRVQPSSGKSFLRADGTVTTADKYLSLDSDGASVLIVYDGTTYCCLSERGTLSMQP